MPFSGKTIEFLVENQLRDSKEWYNAHKDDYKTYIADPFASLITALTPTLLAMDSALCCNPKKISRLYRDTRFSKGKSIFRDNVWFSCGRPKEPFTSVPEVYIDISPNGYSYGCGYYQASRESMDAIRTLILEGDKAFRAAQRAYAKQDVFEMLGDLYKKNHYPDATAADADWLNRKTIYFSCTSKDFDRLFRDDFAQLLAADFEKLVPIFQFLTKAEALAAARRLAKQELQQNGTDE